MTPHKKKDILENISSPASPEETEEVVNFYWTEVITLVRQMEHLSIHIHELGDMRFPKSKIDNQIERTLKSLSEHPEGSHMHEFFTRKLNRLNKLKELRDSEYAHRSEVSEKKNEHRENKKDLDQ